MFRRTFLSTAAALTCLAMLGAGPAAAEPKTIAIANFGEHPQLNAVADGFKAEILASGMAEGTDVVFTLDHVNFDTTLLPQMISKIEATKPALILSITTPVSQNIKNQLGGKGIPVVFSAVTDPVAAGLVPSWESGDANMTGASDALDINATLAFARKLLPDAKVFGVPYNPGEANDVATLDLFKKHGAENGFEIVEIGIDNTNDIQARITAAAGRVDVLYGPASNMIQPAISAVAAAANEAKIPLINSDEGPVREGIIPAAFAVSYDKIGHIAGAIAVRALKGEDLSAIAPVSPAYEDHGITISRKAMEAIGVSIPSSFDGCDCIVD
ncbi:MAG: ABC transporter [Phyllobacteriaceae bacterium]|nr:ABC transporter [Phyllobacteriaceae bacterium]MBA90568.1 ABC transporter [Phyllobacteriaceae bacterium]